ncbi:MAG: LysM peptidoglycan-binding domain-containing protein [Firmicutes bacterium]|nr:LysM peptidoglycan-binding domain-containing protein [Bacillota bacterium]
MSERDPFTLEPIPEFAMRPARENDDSGFDPEVYERLLAGLEVWEPPAEPAPPAEPEEPAPKPEPEATAPLRDAEVTVAHEEQVLREEKEEERTVVSAGAAVASDRLELVDMVPCEPVKIRIEEDVLVPDSKPDLASILTMDGMLRLSENDRNFRGELTLQTLYVPQGKGADRAVIAIESKIPFQKELDPEEQGLGTKVMANIESLEYTIVNERKLRVKAVVVMEGRRYRKRELELFQGLKGDEVQLLQEKLVITDVARRKTELLELEEDLVLPEGMPEVGKILRCDVNLVENHKQISREKAVISGAAYYNIMYLPLEEDAEADGEPVLYQAKGEFTQFITLGRSSDGPQSGRAFFRAVTGTAEAKEAENGSRRLIHVKTGAETFLELYRDVERQIVTDAYHHQKEMVFDMEEMMLMQLYPGGVSETTVREVVSVPEDVESVKRVSFISGDLRNVSSRVENGRNVTEGTVLAKLVCLAEASPALPFQILREIPFRIVSELPQGMENAKPDNEVRLKELRFDRLNNRQIEINASVTVNGAVVCQKRCPLIRNVGFLEHSGPEEERPGLVIYITRSGDTMWNVARRYRTTIDTVARINHLDGSSPLKPGMKLLIVK